MAKTKADLIEEAQERGVVLTGDETVEDLKALLKSADEEEGDAPPEPVAEPEPEPVDPDDPEKHIYLDYGASGSYVREDVKPGELRERRISRVVKVQGKHDLVPRNVTVNLEHVDDSPDGCWRYRQM
jgi:hypothetical protein